MTPFYVDESVTLYAGDALDVLRGLPDNSVDSVVTDPPAGIAFMGKAWDGAKGGREQWSAWLAEIMAEALRVTKPGGHALVWALPRTAHWTACGLEDAGWEIRDRITHLFGSGFPKSLDVGKAIDRAAGAEREIVGSKQVTRDLARNGRTGDEAISPVAVTGTVVEVTAPATDAARRWDGWGTSLKPSSEDWWLCRKPLEGTVAGNVTRWGTGAINVDGCRVEHASPGDLAASQAKNPGRDDLFTSGTYGAGRPQQSVNAAGRWPTNAVLDTAAAAQLDRETGVSRDGACPAGAASIYGTEQATRDRTTVGYGGEGGSSRFFPTFAPPDPLPAWRYEPKAPTFERPRVKADGGGYGRQNYGGYNSRECNVCGSRSNGGNLGEPTCGHGDWKWAEQVNREPDTVAHPTVKPLDLIRWLARLITPPGGTILDMFAGSGTTGEAAVVEGFKAILVEREPAYLPLIVARLSKPIQPDLFGGVA